MKKLYLFMVALFVAIAANAALPDKLYYSQGSDWGTANEMTKKADGIFDADMTFTENNNNRYFLFRTYTGSMSWDGGNNYGAPSNDHEIEKTGVTIANNKNTFMSKVYGTYTVRVDFNTNLVTIYDQGQAPAIGGENPSDATYSVVIKSGDTFGSWDVVKTFQMTKNGNSWEYLFDAKGGFNLKIQEISGSTTTDYGWNGGTLSKDTEYKPTKGESGFAWYPEGKKVTISYTPSSNVAKITENVAAPTYPELVLVGEFNTWNTSDNTVKATSDNGTYTWTLSEMPAGDFKVGTFGEEMNINNTWGNGGVITLGVATPVANNTDDCKLSKDIEDVTITFDYNNTTIKVEGTEKVVEEPEAEYYIYFQNTDNWTEIKVWAWNDTENCTLAGEDGWPGDLMTLVNGNLYRWEAPKGKVPTQIIISNKNGDKAGGGDLTFTNKATYKPDGSIVDPNVPEYADIYFNAGADWYNATVLNFQPVKARLFKVGGGEDVKDMIFLKDEGKEDKDKVELPFFVLRDVKISDYYNIQFECNNYTYNADKSALGYNGGSGSDFDAANWWKYIYATGSQKSAAATDCAAEQTYMTYEEYAAERDREKNTVYFIGSGFNTYEFVENEDGEIVFDTNRVKEVGNWDFGFIPQASKSEGVYLFPVNFKSGVNDILFKMSWVNAEEWRVKVGAATQGTGRDNRWWNTFNLGIVGPTLAPEFNDDIAAAENKGDAKKFDGDLNYSVSYRANRARIYSRYNQYNWWIKKGTLTLADDAARYVVIDTKYNTSALVPFRPAPGLSNVQSNEAKMFDQDLDTENATIIGNQLKGAEIAGLPQVVKINQSTGTATIQVSKGISLYNYNYTVTYYLYHGDDVIAEIEGVPNADKYEISLANMAAGKGEELKVRCLYHDNTNDTYFRSRTESEKIVDEREFAAPVLNNYKTTFFRDGAGWHAQVDADFTIDARNGGTFNYTLATYPDFEFVEHGLATSVRLATSEDDHVKWGIANAHHTKWTEGEYVPETHNWSTIALGNENNGKFENGHIKFVFENIASPEVEELPESRYEFKVNMIAAYPFLINNNASDITVTIKNADGEELDNNGNVIAKAARKAADRVNSYSVAMNNMPTTFEFASDVNGNLSGINDVEMGEEGESVLYNLQGIRVEGDAAPGIYLRRTGSKTQKVVIR